MQEKIPCSCKNSLFMQVNARTAGSCTTMQEKFSFAPQIKSSKKNHPILAGKSRLKFLPRFPYLLLKKDKPLSTEGCPLDTPLLKIDPCQRRGVRWIPRF